MSTHQVFISSYRNDWQFLRPCLYSLRKFCEGFLPPVVCVETRDFVGTRAIADQVYPDTRVVIKDAGWKGPRAGFMRAQIAMMSCDKLSPDNADFYYLVGSDCIAFRKMTPEVYWFRGKPAMLWNSYVEIMADPGGVGMWQTTSRILGHQCDNETMRRLPLIYPRELFEPMRRHVEAIHKMPFEQFIYRFGDHNPVSESNIMGCFAEKYMPEIYTWLHAHPSDEGYVEYRVPGSDSLMQFWSHGGLDRPAETCVEYAPGKNSAGQTPRAVIREILGPIV